MVADVLSLIFEDKFPETPERDYVVLLQSRFLVYSSLEDHQKEDAFRVHHLPKIQAGPVFADQYQLFKRLLCDYGNRAKRRRFVVSVSLKRMALKYFMILSMKDISAI